MKEEFFKKELERLKKEMECNKELYEQELQLATLKSKYVSSNVILIVVD